MVRVAAGRVVGKGVLGGRRQTAMTADGVPMLPPIKTGWPVAEHEQITVSGVGVPFGHKEPAPST